MTGYKKNTSSAPRLSLVLLLFFFLRGRAYKGLKNSNCCKSLLQARTDSMGSTQIVFNFGLDYN